MLAWKCMARSPPHTRWHLRDVTLQQPDQGESFCFCVFPSQKESGTDYILWSSKGVLCVLLLVLRPQRTPSAERQGLCWWTWPVAISMGFTYPDPHQNTNQLWRMSLDNEKKKQSCQQTFSTILALEMLSSYIFSLKNSAQVFIRATNEN